MPKLLYTWYFEKFTASVTSSGHSALRHEVSRMCTILCIPIYVNSLFSLDTPYTCTYVHTTITHTYTTTQTHAYGSIYFHNILIYFYHHRTFSILDSLHSLQFNIGFSHMHVITITYSMN